MVLFKSQNLSGFPITLAMIPTVGGFLTLLTAGPGFVMIIFAIEKLKLHSIVAYSVGGGINSLIALLIFSIFSDGPVFLNLDSFPWIMILSGVVGGWAYHRYRNKKMTTIA